MRGVKTREHFVLNESLKMTSDRYRMPEQRGGKMKSGKRLVVCFLFTCVVLVYWYCCYANGLIFSWFVLNVFVYEWFNWSPKKDAVF